eukprot:562025_1
MESRCPLYTCKYTMNLDRIIINFTIALRGFVLRRNMLIKSSRTALHNLLSNSLRSLSSSSSPTPSASETRQSDEYRAKLERITSEYRRQRQTQAARSMDCGTPFCQSYTGCPLYNLIP